MFDPPSFTCLIYNLAESHSNSSRYIPQFDCATEGPKCCLISGPISSVRPWPRAGQAKEKGFSVSPHLSLQSPGRFCLLKLFSVPTILSQVMKTSTVSLTHVERKYILLYITSVCWTSFIPVGHVLYSSEPSTELFCRMHPKFCIFPIETTPRTFYATESILDMAQREQFQAVYSMDEKTLLYALLSKQEASEKPRSKTSLKQLKLE